MYAATRRMPCFDTVLASSALETKWFKSSLGVYCDWNRVENSLC